MGVPDPPRRPGRPRSPQASQKILAATLEELAAEGYEATTVEGVAQRAGVGKTTIYRRWSSKQALVLAALQDMQAEVAIVDTGDLRQDLLTMLEQALALGTSNTHFQALVFRAATELAAQPVVLRGMLTQLLPARFQEFARLIERAKARGELRADLDTNVALGVIAGSVFYHWLLGGIVSPTSKPAKLAEQIVDAVLRGMAGAK